VPQDEDAFRIALERGDYITASVVVPAAHNQTRVWWRGEDLTLRNGTTEAGVSVNQVPAAGGDISTTIAEEASGANSLWEIWANTDTVVCVVVSERSITADFPYEWQVSFQRNSPDVNQSNRQVLSEAEIRQRNQRLIELQEEVANLTGRVSELERRISQLENETNSTESG